MPCKTDTQQWLEATVYLDINPSSANYMDLYYRCDSTLQNGWLLRMGDADDGLKLIERKSGKERIECKGEIGYFNKTKSNITVRWVKQDKQFILLYKDSSWDQFNVLCAAIDTLPYTFQYFGLGIVQTGSGAAGKHRVPNLSVTPPRPDKTPPTIQSLQWQSPSTAIIQFSEPILLQNKNQLICGFQQALSFAPINKKTLEATFSPQTCNDTHRIFVQNAQDSAGNVQPLAQRVAFLSCPTPVNPFDITITEIMADPLPSRGFLPPVQYIELKNQSTKRLWLSELTLSDLQTSIALPSHLLQPQERVTLCHENDTALMKNIPNVIGCKLPYLNIESETLTLLNKERQIIHQIQYNKSMHHPAYEEGGYSLEHSDTTNYCIDLFQWKSNTVLGGTPSMPPTPCEPYPTAKTTPPNVNMPFEIAYLGATHPDTAVVVFTHPLKDSLPKLHAIDNGIDYRFLPLNNPPNRYIIQPPLRNNQRVMATVTPVQDCQGNWLSQTQHPLGFSWDFPMPGDLLFNEVMFNASDYLCDYVEIANISNKVLQLQGLQLQVLTDQLPVQVITLSDESHLLYPGELRCFSAQPYQLSLANNPAIFFQHQHVLNFPNLPASEATLQLTHPLGNVIDEMTYSESQHIPILPSNKGVSLEKTSPQAPSGQTVHWVSATATAGYATPGEINSQCSQPTKKLHNAFNLSKTVYAFQTEEYITLQHQLPKSGYVVKLSLYSFMGSKITLPLPTVQVSQDGQILIPLWPLKSMLPSGNYILHVDAFHPDADICRQNLRLLLVH